MRRRLRLQFLVALACGCCPMLSDRYPMFACPVLFPGTPHWLRTYTCELILT
ncbi:mCG1049220 [Mus musculus]|nr:mCG1049220 [Mus musculus]